MKKMSIIPACLLTFVFLAGCDPVANNDFTNIKPDTTPEKKAFLSKVIGTWVNPFDPVERKYFSSTYAYDKVVIDTNKVTINGKVHTFNPDSDLFFADEVPASSGYDAEYAAYHKEYDDDSYLPKENSLFIRLDNDEHGFCAIEINNQGFRAFRIAFKPEYCKSEGITVFLENRNSNNEWTLGKDSHHYQVRENSSSAIGSSSATAKGSYSYEANGRSQYDGTILLANNGSWSFNGQKKTTITGGSYTVSGNKVTLTYESMGYSNTEVFKISKNGTKSTWTCDGSMSTLFSTLFGVITNSLDFSFAE